MLVVDDDPRLRDLLSRYLSEQGFAALTAQDRAAMDRLLDRDRADVLVLDLMLPGGRWVIDLPPAARAGKDIGIVMLTAKAMRSTASSAWRSAQTDYLPKLVNPRELVARESAADAGYPSCSAWPSSVRSSHPEFPERRPPSFLRSKRMERRVHSVD